MAPLPLPEEGGVENLENLDKRVVFSISGSQEGMESHGRPNIRPQSSSSFTCWPYSCTLSQPVEPGKRCTAHSDTSPVCSQAAQVGSLCSTLLPNCGYGGGSVGPNRTVSGYLASATQPVSLASADHHSWLCDSVRLASPQVQRHLLHNSEGGRCYCLACGDRSPTDEGCDRANPSNRHEDGVFQPLLHCTQEWQWVMTNLGPASLEPARIQNITYVMYMYIPKIYLHHIGN
uniref:Uncharacterized protein n=1 Tax=Cyprinus carpio carpio TaxID=630221 RepID=A0A9J7XN51_CYPCA